MKCTKCGSDINPDAQFCNNCGQKVPEVAEITAAPKEEKKSFLIGAISVVGFLLTAAAVFYFTVDAIFPSTSKADIINQAVQEAKSQYSLPTQMDGGVTFTDVTAQPDAIRYHYTLTGVDTSELSNQYLKNFLTSDICGSVETNSLLNQDINMEYSYVVSETGQSYFVAVSKSDCY